MNSFAQIIIKYGVEQMGINYGINIIANTYESYLMVVNKHLNTSKWMYNHHDKEKNMNNHIFENELYNENEEKGWEISGYNFIDPQKKMSY